VTTPWGRNYRAFARPLKRSLPTLFPYQLGLHHPAEDLEDQGLGDRVELVQRLLQAPLPLEPALLDYMPEHREDRGWQRYRPDLQRLNS